MVELFKNAYLFNLKNPYTRYVTETTLYLINHSYKNYPRICVTYMAKNDEFLRLPYNPQEPLESLMKMLYMFANFKAAASEMVT